MVDTSIIMGANSGDVMDSQARERTIAKRLVVGGAARIAEHRSLLQQRAATDTMRKRRKRSLRSSNGQTRHASSYVSHRTTL